MDDDWHAGHTDGPSELGVEGEGVGVARRESLPEPKGLTLRSQDVLW
jgi:hypothetical protein